MRPVHLGVVGLGRMGRYHASNIAGRLPGLRLAGVADTDAQLAREVAAELETGAHTSLESLLAVPDLEAVVIASPTPYHVSMIEETAAAGKHVFCEKPIALDVAATQRAVAAADAAGVKLQIGFHRRFDPDWAEAKRRIAQGDLGDVLLFRTSLRDKQVPPLEFLTTSGGLFQDVTVHDLDTARWLVGEVTEVSSVGAAIADPRIADLDDVDHAIVTLRFASGAIGVIDNSRAAGYGYECSTEVVGSRAAIRIGNHRRAHCEWLTPGASSVDWVVDFRERYPHAYMAELEAFAACISSDTATEPSGADGLAALVLAQACEESLRMKHVVRVVAPNGG
jgi:myo-inositol 2-dehydrogenase/D-chiro-inositol 1-dehydrogenase